MAFQIISPELEIELRITKKKKNPSTTLLFGEGGLMVKASPGMPCLWV
jgi:hypothetical protein